MSITLTPVRRRALAVLALAAGAVLVAACGGGGDDAAATTTSKPTTTTTTEPPPAAPLTGLPSDDETVQRAALVLKIDNHNDKARPQVGINQADVVYEEQVEGGVTRLAAVFHSTGSDPVGPIRSGRTTDISIVTPLNRPLFGFSGANSATLREILQAAIVDVRWDAQQDHYEKDRSRPGPHNLFTSTDDLWDAADDGTHPPSPLFTFRPVGEALAHPDAQTVGEFAVTFGGSAGYGNTWTWDAASKLWARDQLGTPHVDADGVQVKVPNVIVQLVPYEFRFGNPEAQLVGSGDAWIFTDGKVVEGRWSKGSIAEATSYTDVAGQPIALTPGRTWVELPAVGRPPTYAVGPSTTSP